MKPGDVKGSIDFGIITIREDEFEAVLDRFPEDLGIISGRRQYNLRRIAADDPYTIAIVRCAAQANSEAQQVANALLDELEPRWLLVVGIGGGAPAAEFTLGDVVVATEVCDFNVGAVLNDGSREYTLHGWMSHPEVAKLAANLPAMRKQLGTWNASESVRCERPNIKVSAKSLYGAADWQKKVRQSLKSHISEGRHMPKVTAGAIACSDLVMKDAELFEVWLKFTRQVIAVEMESAGVHKAAQERHVPFMSVRGLSDIVGFRRDPRWTAYACHSAAAFTLAFLCTRPIPVATASAQLAEGMGSAAKHVTKSATKEDWFSPDSGRVRTVGAGPTARQTLPSENSLPGILAQLASVNAKQLIQQADVDLVAIGDAVIITQSPNCRGWSRSEIETRVLCHGIALPAELDVVLKERIRLLSRDYYDSPVYRFVSFRPALRDYFDRLVVTLAPALFLTFFAASSALDEEVFALPDGHRESIRARYAKDCMNFNSPDATTSPIPNHVGIHLVVASQDEKLILMRRSLSVGFYPGTWALSLEETMNTHDRDFIDTAIRGIREELGIEVKVDPDDVRVLSIALDHLALGVNVICIAKVRSNADEIRSSWLLHANDKDEAERLTCVDYTIEAVLPLVMSEKLPQHATTRLRGVQALMHKFGINDVLRAIGAYAAGTEHASEGLIE